MDRARATTFLFFALSSSLMAQRDVHTSIVVSTDLALPIGGNRVQVSDESANFHTEVTDANGVTPNVLVPETDFAFVRVDEGATRLGEVVGQTFAFAPAALDSADTFGINVVKAFVPEARTVTLSQSPTDEPELIYDQWADWWSMKPNVPSNGVGATALRAEFRVATLPTQAVIERYFQYKGIAPPVGKQYKQAMLVRMKYPYEIPAPGVTVHLKKNSPVANAYLDFDIMQIGEVASANPIQGYELMDTDASTAPNSQLAFGIEGGLVEGDNLFLFYESSAAPSLKTGSFTYQILPRDTPLPPGQGSTVKCYPDPPQTPCTNWSWTYTGSCDLVQELEFPVEKIGSEPVCSAQLSGGTVTRTVTIGGNVSVELETGVVNVNVGEDFSVSETSGLNLPNRVCISWWWCYDRWAAQYRCVEEYIYMEGHFRLGTPKVGYDVTEKWFGRRSIKDLQPPTDCAY